jgi:peptidoglycan-N-acetylglucosamine deacetylase
MSKTEVRGRATLRFAVAATIFAFATQSTSVVASLAPSENSNSPPPSLRAIPVNPQWEIKRGLRGKHQIALTFDAGGEVECFQELVTDLESARVHSTFFVTGRWAESNPECAREIIQHGHELGNHTWHHLDLTKQPDQVVRSELMQAEAILKRACGQSPKPYWRAPFGERTPRVLRLVHEMGYRSVYWTIDSLDSVEPPKTPAFLVERIISHTDAELDGAIVLFHVGERNTAEALPEIIRNLKSRGFEMVTISQLLNPLAAHMNQSTN